ncbi:MAG TPA: AAA family ATPase [Candidatus Hydrogenedentes bacterium]|jgi:MoxR-like ATPase|nr:AAA family ATPase [Candidatus Hydrogenedentota bacterium]MDY0033727.1 AAA family ATPase [FCB group bacterium]NLT60314.1 AAA domain-containing protein [Candidatus Hydrogenedentota bacterium]HNZ18450.1 AAA family ATPase [Candidatus Hydrogenedentota bacterium]HOH33822.1 AAA family ATPase [Candidatus Hydrogenedentota bacterium]
MNHPEEAAAGFRDDFQRLHEEIAKVIVGAQPVIDGVLTCLFASGHCLLEGVPGLGKTLLVRTLSQALDLQFSRIQFTPDLMPADIIGTNIVVEDESGNREFRFRQGPIFANIILADEINRATPKTQSALLEAMQEHTVSVARTSHRLEEPFFVMATQNPIEMEGTYTLPEAQLDRFFFKLLVTFPGGDDLAMILDRTTQREMPRGEKVMDAARLTHWAGLVRDVPVAPQVTSYVVRLVTATHPENPEAPEIVRQYVRYGSSPRGAQALLLAGKVNALRAGRFNVSFNDIQKTAHSALRHRVLLNFEAEADGVAPDQVVDALLKTVDTKAKVA